MSLALAIALCLAPQGDPVLAGRVVDEQGKAVAGAKVTLLARALPLDLDRAREHRVVATTDANGAFRAPLHADGTYSVWAATANAATAIAEGESAPGFLELRLLAGTGPRTLRVDGLGAWEEAATFRYRALVGGENLDFAPVVCRDGALAVPPLPPLTRRAIEVLAADGRVLWAALPATTNAVVELPPPQSWTVRVTDADAKPLQGVDVCALVRGYRPTESALDQRGERNVWSTQPPTDADGKVAMRLTAPPLLLSRKEGYAPSLDGRLHAHVVRAGKAAPVEPTAPNHIDVVLRAAPSVAVPLMLRSGAPLAVDVLGVRADLLTTYPTGARGQITFDFVVPIRNGVASMPRFPADTVFVSAATTLAPEVREVLRQRFGFAPQPAFLLPHPTALPGRPPFDPETWHALFVITSDGRPAANTLVALCESATDWGKLLRTDRAGRLLFEAQRAVRVVIYGPAGCGTIDVPATAVETRLQLRSVRPAAGRTVDADGKPVAFANVLVSLGGATDAKDAAIVFVANSPGRLRARSDAEGRFEVLLPPFAARVNLAASWDRTAPRLEVDWDPAKPPELVLTVPSQ